MTLQQEISLHKEDLTKRQISSAIVDPPLYRLLWKLGVSIKPPLFSTGVAMSASSLMGGALIAVGLNIFQDYSASTILLITICSVLGLMLMTYLSHRHIRSKYSIPRDWGAYISKLN